MKHFPLTLLLLASLTACEEEFSLQEAIFVPKELDDTCSALAELSETCQDAYSDEDALCIDIDNAQADCFSREVDYTCDDVRTLASDCLENGDDIEFCDAIVEIGQDCEAE